MSAAPSATLGEWETITMPTFVAHAVSRHVDDGGDHQRRGTGAGIHMADRAVAQEGGAAADRLHVDGGLGGLGRDPLDPIAELRIRRRTRPAHRAPAPARPAWSSARHRICRAPSPHRKPRRRPFARSARLGIGRQFLAEGQEQRAVKRAGCAADLHHQMRADRLDRVRQGLAAKGRRDPPAPPRSRASC